MTIRTITVTGQGVAAAVPDAAVVRLGATSRAATLGEAVGLVNAVTEQLITVAKAYAPDNKIGTQGFSVWPGYDNQGQPSGFEARHPLVVGCASLQAAGDMLTQMIAEVKSGFVVDSVGLEVSDPSSHLTAAREAAFADARIKAEQLANLAGASLGEVVTVTEAGGYAAPRSAQAGAEMALKADVSFSPGEAQLTQAVNVTWELL